MFRSCCCCCCSWCCFFSFVLTCVWGPQVWFYSFMAAAHYTQVCRSLCVCVCVCVCVWVCWFRVKSPVRFLIIIGCLCGCKSLLLDSIELYWVVLGFTGFLLGFAWWWNWWRRKAKGERNGHGSSFAYRVRRLICIRSKLLRTFFVGDNPT